MMDFLICFIPDTMLGGKRDSLNSEFSQATTIPALASAPPNFDDVTDGFDTMTTSKTGSFFVHGN